jgi:hypothetical protein
MRALWMVPVWLAACDELDQIGNDGSDVSWHMISVSPNPGPLSQQWRLLAIGHLPAHGLLEDKEQGGVISKL